MLKKAQASNYVLFLIIAILAFIVFQVIGISPKIIYILLALSFFFLAFFNTSFALTVLVFAMLLSPEIPLGGVSGRSIVLRIDDVILFIVFLGWFAKMAVNKELGLFRYTKLNLLMIAYITVCAIATLVGIFVNNINPVKSFFYILKYFEYFLLYFMVSNNLKDKKQIKNFISCFFITCIITCIWALLTIGKTGRATAPFEGAVAEPNTLGGYLVLMLGLAAGLYIYTPIKKWRLPCLIVTLFGIPTLLATLSRSSYVAFIAMSLAIVFISKKKKVLLINIFLILLILLPFILPKNVIERIEHTFSPYKTYQISDRHKITLEGSASARVDSWTRIFKKWTKRPILGYGITGVGLVDTQYPLILGETGIVGFLVFMLLCLRIFKAAFFTFRNMDDDWFKGLSLGFLAGFIGLLTHSIGANTFIIVRIMEPFWFLTAIIIVLPRLAKEPQSAQKNFA